MTRGDGARDEAVDVAGGADMDIDGNILGHEFKITQGGREIAEISQKWFRVRDSYGIDIQPGQDDALILAIGALYALALILPWDRIGWRPNLAGVPGAAGSAVESGARFVERAEARGIERKTGEELFASIEDFARYGFNKAHAADYAVMPLVEAIASRVKTIRYFVAGAERVSSATSFWGSPIWQMRWSAWSSA